MAKKAKIKRIRLSDELSDLDRERLQLALAALFNDDTKIMGHAEERRSAITVTLSSGQTERILIPDFSFVKRPSRLEGQWRFEAFKFSALEGNGGFGHAYPASFYIKYKDDGKVAIRRSTKLIKLQNKVIPIVELKRELRVSRVVHQGKAHLNYSSHEQDSEKSFFVMPFLQGRPFYEFIYDEKSSFFELLLLAIAFFEELKIKHEQGIVHHDIKVDNVLLEGKKAHLIDFGCSFLKINGELKTKHNEKLLKGALSFFMAPEVYNAKKKRHFNLSVIDQSNDLYSAGCLLARMFGVSVDSFERTIREDPSTNTEWRDKLELDELFKRAMPRKDSDGQVIRDLICDLMKDQPQDRPSVDNVLARLRALEQAYLELMYGEMSDVIQDIITSVDKYAPEGFEKLNRKSGCCFWSKSRAKKRTKMSLLHNAKTKLSVLKAELDDPTCDKSSDAYDAFYKKLHHLFQDDQYKQLYTYRGLISIKSLLNTLTRPLSYLIGRRHGFFLSDSAALAVRSDKAIDTLNPYHTLKSFST